jgi:hypothetical protein
MADKSIILSLIFATGTLLLPGCASRTTTEAPPQTPAGTEAASPDAGLPAVPLTGKGVIVPSDVKLEPSPKASTSVPAGISSATGTPNTN